MALAPALTICAPSLTSAARSTVWTVKSHHSLSRNRAAPPLTLRVAGFQRLLSLKPASACRCMISTWALGPLACPARLWGNPSLGWFSSKQLQIQRARPWTSQAPCSGFAKGKLRWAPWTFECSSRKVAYSTGSESHALISAVRATSLSHGLVSVPNLCF